jgi:uncharacterized protein YjdB
MEGTMRRTAVVGLLFFACSCTPEPKSLAVDPETEAIGKKDGAVTFRALVKDAKGQRIFDSKHKPLWTSSNPAVATVDDAGRVKGLKSGEAVISAAVGALKGEGKVKVSFPASLTLTPPTLEFKEPGQVASIEAKVADDAGNALPGKTPDWSSTDIKVARVAAGQVSAMAPGKATITAALDDLKAKAEVTVKSVAVPDFKKLVVKPATLTLKKGGTGKLTATAQDKKGKPVGEVQLFWVSSNDAIATVADGTVTGVKKGGAKIIVGGKGFEKKTTTAKVTVK